MVIIMHKRIRLVTIIVLILSLLPCLSGCNKKKVLIQYDSGAYTSSIFDIPSKDDYKPQLRSVLKDGDNTCISVVYSKYDSTGILIDQITDIFTVDDYGNRLFTLELIGDQPPCVVLENEYAFLGYKIEEIEKDQDRSENMIRSAVFLDKKTGDFCRAIETDFQPYYIAEISDGFVIVGSSTIGRYSKQGDLIKKIDLEFSCYIDNIGFFEENGKYYILEEKELGELVYHSLDFESGTCTALASSIDIGMEGMNADCNYFFNSDGEYKVNLSDMKVECIADWNCIDIRPPKKMLYTPSAQYSIDDERFAISYEYRDLSSEVMLFRHDPSIDRSQVETIKIGGYGVYDDPILQWAVYTFNVSNKDYRAVLEDYGQRFEGYTPEERRKATLNLTQYFNEGNTPDIFYGTRFDYEYMGRNGMVIDMAGYVNSDKLSLTNTAYHLMYNGEGACYQLFSGYVTYGYYVQKSVADALSDTSVSSLYQYAIEHDIPYSMASASDIIDEGIRYDFANLFGAYDGDQKISKEELETLVSIAVSQTNTQSHYASKEDVVNGKSLMTPAIGYCYVSHTKLGEDPFQYIGYPSVRGSVYLAVPQCCLAISTTAKNKDACWKVLASLIQDDAQKQTLLSGNIPVTQYMINEFTDMVLHPERITDEVLITCITCDKDVSQEDVERFLRDVEKVDTVATYDWGIFDIINDEINSYYSQNRSPEQIADTLEKRLTLYMQENYQ